VRGIGLIYISHRLDEVLQIADSREVLRDGQRVATVAAANASVDSLASDMLGKAVQPTVFRAGVAAALKCCVSRNLTRQPTSRTLLELYAEDCRLADCWIGPYRAVCAASSVGYADSGKIYSGMSRPVSIHSPRDAVALGMGMLPEDRQEQSAAAG